MNLTQEIVVSKDLTYTLRALGQKAEVKLRTLTWTEMEKAIEAGGGDGRIPAFLSCCLSIKPLKIHGQEPGYDPATIELAGRKLDCEAWQKALYEFDADSGTGAYLCRFIGQTILNDSSATLEQKKESS